MPETIDLNAILASADAATEGPWTDPEWDEYERGWVVMNSKVGPAQHAVAYTTAAWGPRAQQDAEFIALARAAVPQMAEEIRQLRAAVRRVVSITQDTDGDALGIDETVPVGEVLRMLYEFHEDVVERACLSRSANEPGA